MFFRKSGPSSNVDSLIGARTRIEGDVFFSGGLRLDGSVRGRVCTLSERTGTLVVGESGRVDGEVAVQHLLVNGAVEGRIVGAETLELRSGARVRGDVCYTMICVQEGAIIEGPLAHRARDEAKPEAALKLATNG